ncbi:MAG: hypothetical protein V7607_3937 [Solirubrobacteraceae bacterium]
MDLFREEQDSLTREIQVVEGLLKNIDGRYRDDEQLLLQALNVGSDIAEIYRSTEDGELRRIMNQVFFRRFEVGVDGTVDGTAAQPFAELSAGSVVDVLKRVIASAREVLESANPAHLFDGQGSNLLQMVGAAGLEPATSRV